MEALEEKLGYRFTNRALLENALTHSSYANENKAKGLQSNERLEFLGLLGCHQNYAVIGTGTINSCGSRIFQHLYGFNI